MSKFIILTRVLIKNGGNPFGNSSSKRNKISFIILVLAFLPIIIGSTFALLKGYDMLHKLHLEGAILASLMASACIAMIVLGILYVISIYYFVDDVSSLIVMPIKPNAILGAKFVIVTIYQYILEVIVVLPALVAFGIRINTPVYWLYSILIFITLPIIPNVICSLVSIILMSTSKLFKNKDRVKLISGIVAMAFSLGISFAFQFIGEKVSGPTLFVNNSSLIKQASMIFPSSRLVTNALLNNLSLSGFIDLVLFLLISVFALVIFLYAAEGLYLEGAVGVTQSSSHGKKLSEEGIERASTSRSKLMACMISEWRSLVRTPAYLMNCLFGAFIVPPILIGSLAITMPKGLLVLRTTPINLGILVIAVTAMCCMNLAAPTAISREGKNFYITRFVPVKYETQINAKLTVANLLSYFSLVFTAVIAICLIKIDILLVLCTILIGVFSITFINIIGIFVDINFPKLDWDDETRAVKQNFNVIIQMLFSVVIPIIPVFLLYKLELSYSNAVLFLLAFFIVCCIFMYRVLLKYGVKIFSSSNNYYANASESKKVDKKAVFKLVRIVTIALFTVIFVGIVIFEFTVKTKITIKENTMSIKAGFGESATIKVNDIQDVYIKDTIPEAHKEYGYNSGSAMRGKFTVEGMGSGYVYTQNGKAPFLYIKLKNSFVIINYSDKMETERIYNKLKPLVSK